MQMKLEFFITILLFYCIFYIEADISFEDVIKDPSTITFLVSETKYCGAGNRAKYYDDLGKEKETDLCCRAHDMCEESIEAGKEKHNMKNNSAYTRLPCNCDWTFFHCLKKVVEETNSKAAKIVGESYFDLLNTKCYDLKPKISGCWKYKTRDRCKTYYFFMETELLWQWFDVPLF